MKRHFYIFGIMAALIALWTVSCTGDKDVDRVPDVSKEGYNMNITTRASADEVMNRMSLYTFHNNGGGANDKTFMRKLPSTYADDRIKSSIETGFWHLTMVSAPVGTPLIAPVAGTPMASVPLYEYAPGLGGGKSSDAAEIYTSILTLPEVQADQTITVNDVPVSRNMAMVDVIFIKTTPNFTRPGGANHVVKIHGVPNKISYAGTLMPSASAPSKLTNPLQSNVTFKDSGVYPGYFASDTIRFIIPAHKGTDYLQANPIDTVKTRMSLEVSLQRSGGGSYFTSTKEIPVVAKCNKITRIHVSVDDGMEFTTEVLPWNEVKLTPTVGEGYSNWLYVKKNATGSGQSWRDATGSIADAISKATVLKNAGYTVHGVLVAGDDTNPYEEGFSVNAGVRVFGGWEGTPTTELSANDANAAYTSPHRKLQNHKAVVNLGTKNIDVSASGALLDGFVLQGVSSSNTSILNVNHASASVNAIVIQGQSMNSGNVLNLTGTASNMLIADNNRGIAVSAGGTLISSTITNNTASSALNNAVVYNTIFWHSPHSLDGTNDIQYSAFIGEINTIPAGVNNYHINTTNDAWFSPSVNAPGPHFKLTNDAEKYEAGNKRSPLLGHASYTLFNNYAGFPAGSAKDINGKTRYFTDPNDPTSNLMDIGCFEQPQNGLAGFRLEWLSKNMYISSKGGYESNLPLMIPNNEDPEIAISVNVTATMISGISSISAYNGYTPSAAWTTTNGIVIGYLNFKNPGSTPTNDYTGNTARTWGKIAIETGLGGYLPNTEISILQAPGASVNWEDGYVGSFHRNDQVGARYIHGPNIGAWEVRVLAGLDWIKIDGHDKNYGQDITDPGEGLTPSGGNYKQVEEIWGGVLSGSGPIKFRVGMKSKNTKVDPVEGKIMPRYGLIIITRTVSGKTGSAMFFVRQGEEADYLYRPEDDRTGGRPNAVRFSPFNIMAPTNVPNGGTNVGSGNSSVAISVTHPSKIGDYFMWDKSVAYRRGAQTSYLPSVRPNNTGAMTIDPCPQGYRHGKLEEWTESLYQNVSWNYNNAVSPGDAASLRNFTYGRYADGHYDQIAPDPLVGGTNGTNLVGNYSANNWNDQAIKGMLMINHFTYATVFFPCAEIMYQGRTRWSIASDSDGNAGYALYNCSSKVTTSNRNNRWHNAHWCTGHVGMNCSVPAGAATGTTGHQTNGGFPSLSSTSASIFVHAVPVRCVVDE